MMQLRRISLVCWHLLERADLDLYGDTAILGRNRSGKSTLIDLIQAVIAGGSPKLFRFNRSAGEGGGRSDRTLRTYSLGMLNDDTSLRTEAVTHIALGFEDSFGERPPVTVGLCIETPAREEAQVVGRYVAEGVRPDTALFVQEREDGAFSSADWTLARRRLEAACASAGKPLRINDKAVDHIREYMRLLFTTRRARTPETFAKTFVLALSFEDMASVPKFVTTYLLEPNPIDIGELRLSITRYREIQREIAELQERLEALQVLQSMTRRYADLLLKEEIATGEGRLASFKEAAEALRANLVARRDQGAALKLAEAELARYAEEVARLDQRADSLRDQIAAEDANSQSALLKSEIALAQRERDAVMRRLQARHVIVARATGLLQHRAVLQPMRVGELTTFLDMILRTSAGLSPPEWPRDPAGLEEQIGRAAAAATSSLTRIDAEREDAISLKRASETLVQEHAVKLSQARHGQVSLDRRTEQLMQTLRREGMQPRALCQVLEVLDETWREAIEGLLGPDREAILVDPEHASVAVERLRAGRDAYTGCRVVNTRRLQGASTQTQPGSLASVLSGSDPLAMAFVVRRAGSVRLAMTQAELFGGERAIMTDGAYNNGLSIEVRRAREMKIGRAAAALALEFLQGELTTERTNHARLSARVALLDDIRRRVQDLSDAPADEDKLDRLVGEFTRAEEALEELQARFASVLSTASTELREELTRIRAELKTLRTDQEDVRNRVSRLQTERDQVQRLLGGGAAQAGSVLHWRYHRGRLRERVRNLAQLRPVKARYEPLRISMKLDAIISRMRQEAERLREEYRQIENEVRHHLARYGSRFGGEHPAAVTAGILNAIGPWVEENVTALEHNELMRYREQADAAADSIVRLFRTGFVQELTNRFSALEEELKALNTALRTHPLHGEVYRLSHRIKPDFAALHRLAQESEHDEDLFAALFGRAAPRDESHAEALAEVERLLQDEESDFTRYEDYREYYTYELLMRDEASGRETSYERRRGVGSGAERQVPFYVVIGAALAGAYHGVRRFGAPAGLGLGLAVFDEAFSKLDGPNQRILLDFYREIGLQVVIAAPSEKRAVVLENLDSIIDVHRSGDHAYAETAHIKPHARQAMRAANPQHLSDEDLRARLADQEAAPVAAE